MFWDRLPLTSEHDYLRHIQFERTRFWNEVIGRLPDPTLPANPRARFIREEGGVAIYEVVVDVWPDISAWAWVAVPKIRFFRFFSGWRLRQDLG